MTCGVSVVAGVDVELEEVEESFVVAEVEVEESVVSVDVDVLEFVGDVATTVLIIDVLVTTLHSPVSETKTPFLILTQNLFLVISSVIVIPDGKS